MGMRNKKAIFFTMAAIIIIVLFLASFSLYSDTKDRKAIQKRVETMNSFMSGVEKDLSRKLYISTYRTVFLVESEIINDGAYINNLDSFFSGAFIRGEIDGAYSLALDGYNISAIVEDVRNDSGLVGANFTIETGGANVVISQDDPWHIKATLTLNMSLIDLSGLAKMDKKNTKVYAYVPITNFEDPIYFIETASTVSNSIVRSPYESQFLSSDYTNLSRHANNSYYIANSAAPSFLKRLRGDLSNDANGIESFVNIPRLQSQGVSIDSGKSNIDYIYFNHTKDPGYYTVPSMPLSWFRVDNSTVPQRLTLYNITGQVGPN